MFERKENERVFFVQLRSLRWKIIYNVIKNFKGNWDAYNLLCNYNKKNFAIDSRFYF